MTRELAPPPIDGTWSAPRGRWSAPERRPPSDHCDVRAVDIAPRDVADAIAMLRAALYPRERVGLTWFVFDEVVRLADRFRNHSPELPHRSAMHARCAHRRRSRRPARRNR